MSNCQHDPCTSLSGLAFFGAESEQFLGFVLGLGFRVWLRGLHSSLHRGWGEGMRVTSMFVAGASKCKNAIVEAITAFTS